MAVETLGARCTVVEVPRERTRGVSVSLKEYSPGLTEMMKGSDLLINFPIFAEEFMEALKAGSEL